jgi:hypothetical protein
MNGDLIVFAVLIIILFSWLAASIDDTDHPRKVPYSRGYTHIPDDLEEGWYSKAERRYLKKEEE